MPPQLPVAGFHERCPVRLHQAREPSRKSAAGCWGRVASVKGGGQYRKGSARERLFIKYLYEGTAFSWDRPMAFKAPGIRVNPCLWAARTAGSHSKVDVMGVWPDAVRLFQLKSGSGKVSDLEVAYLARLVEGTGGGVECWAVEWPDYCPPSLRRVR